MELTLKRLLEQAEFSRVKRGYDTDEVDDFLDRAVAMATKVEVRLTQAIAQAKAVEEAPDAGAAPATVGDPDIAAEVERRLQVRLAEQAAASPSGPTAEETAEEARRTLLLAQRTADEVVREAREDAARMVSEAESRAADTKAASEAEAAAARSELSNQIEAERKAQRERLGAEIDQLEGVRTTLRTDLSALERHVEEQRSQLRSTVGELQRLLDDPTGFRMAPAPAPVAQAPPSPDPGAAPTEAPASPEVTDLSPDDATDHGTEPDPHPSPDPDPDPEPAVGPSDEPAPAPGLEKAGDPSVPELTFDEVDHEAPGDGGAPTAEVSAVELGIDLSGHPVGESGSDDDPGASGTHDDRSDESPQKGPDLAASPPGSNVDGSSAEDDPFLSELRKAIGDEEPLGPRDSIDRNAAGPRDELFEGERRPWRFGKRR